MRNPGSIMARIRFTLAQAIEPSPDIGEAWYLDCRLNDMKTVVIPADSMFKHAVRHVQTGDGGTAMTLRGSFPP